MGGGDSESLVTVCFYIYVWCKSVGRPNSEAMDALNEHDILHWRFSAS